MPRPPRLGQQPPNKITPAAKAAAFTKRVVANMDVIYLDNNATSCMLPEVREAISEAYALGYANPASQHMPGQRARRVLEDAREEIAAILGANLGGPSSDYLIFTSGGTEANNLALFGLRGEPGSNVVVSAIEHPSILNTRQELQRRGSELRVLPVDRRGTVQLDALTTLVDEQTRLVSVMVGNNETGVLQPVAAISAWCRTRGILFHTDAVQAVGKISVRFEELGADALTLSAHKCHGPVGLGALLLRGGVVPKPMLFGGTQQHGLRPGTESVPLVLGTLKALQLWQATAEQRLEHLSLLRDRLENKLLAEIPSLIINGATAERLPHTANLAFPGLNRQALLMALDVAGVAASTGSACSSGSSEPSHVLRAMGLDEAVIESSIRLSWSVLTTPAEIDLAARRIIEVHNALQQGSPRRASTSPSRHSAARPV